VFLPLVSVSFIKLGKLRQRRVDEVVQGSTWQHRIWLRVLLSENMTLYSLRRGFNNGGISSWRQLQAAVL